MVWLDYGTDEWDMYAANYHDVRGVELLPQSRIGGKGNWFRWLGEKQQRA